MRFQLFSTTFDLTNASSQDVFLRTLIKLHNKGDPKLFEEKLSGVDLFDASMFSVKHRHAIGINYQYLEKDWEKYQKTMESKGKKQKKNTLIFFFLSVNFFSYFVFFVLAFAFLCVFSNAINSSAAKQNRNT